MIDDEMADICHVAWFDVVVLKTGGCVGKHFCTLTGEHDVHCCGRCDDLWVWKTKDDV